MTREVLALLRLAGLLVLLGLAYWLGGQILDFIRAPVQAQLDAATANNQGFKAAAEKSNAAIDEKKRVEADATAQSAKAVKAAGERELKAAAALTAKPAPGSTPIERAANRINREFGR